MLPKILWVCLLLAGGCTSRPNDEEPILVLRCVEGRVNAYMAMGGSGGIEEDQMIPVQLDSAPGCEG